MAQLAPNRYGIVFGALVAFLACAPDYVAGQSLPALTITVDSNDPEALVFADSVLVGRAEDSPFVVSSSTRTVRFTPPTIGSWSVQPIRETVPAGADSVHFKVRFPHQYSIRSEPSGATIVLVSKDSTTVVGTTPLVFESLTMLDGAVTLNLDGYFEESVPLGTEFWNHHTKSLRIKSASAIVGYREPVVRRRRWIDVAAVTLAAAGGVAAVHYKFKADRRFDVYQETGDPALRPAIDDLDLRSGIALGAMQAGITVFVFRLATK